MTGLPPDVRRLARLLLPEEAAEVILGDLEEEAATRFPAGRGPRRGLWLRLELLRSVLSVRLARVGDDARASREPSGGSGIRGLAAGLDGLFRDLRFAVRSLARDRSSALFAAGTLALGVGSATAVFSAVDRVVLNPLPYPDSDRMVVLWRTTDGEVVFVPEIRHVRAWRELDVFEEVQLHRSEQAVLTGRGPPEEVSVKRVAPGYVDFLGIRPAVGRGISAGEHARGDRIVLLDHDFWLDRFGGDLDVVGSTISLDDEPWSVIGVLPPGSYAPNSGPGLTDLWTPMGDAGEQTPVFVAARLREGVDVARADERLRVFAEGAPAAGLGPTAEWRGKAFEAESFGRGRVAETLKPIFWAVSLLLLVSALNTSSLLFQRSTARRRETAVRAALGAGRGRLLRAVFVEALVVAAAGGVLGLALAWGAIEILERIRPTRIGWLLDGIRIHAPVLAFSLAVTVGAALVGALLPALRVLRREPGSSGLVGSRGGGSDGAFAGRSRWLLVAGEVAFSFALLTCGIVVASALGELGRRDPGFDTNGLVGVEVTLPEWRYGEEAERRAAFEAIRDALQGAPGVQRVGLADGLPPGLPGTIVRLHPEGREPARETSYLRGMEVSGDFLALLGQPLVAGRDLTGAERDEATEPVVVGRLLADRLFPGLAPIDVVGRTFRLSAEGDPLRVVGVAEDILVDGPAHDARRLLMYRPWRTWSGREVLAVRLDPGTEPGAWLRDVGPRAIVLSAAPEGVIDVEPTTEAMARTLVQERFTTLLIGAFSVLGLLLSGVGLYGVLAHTVTSRRREIGIRMSLGADGASIRSMVVRSGAAATLAGLAVGAGVAFVGLRILSGSAFGIEPGAPSAYLLAAGALGAVAWAATWIPARRATLLDPTVAIREE